MKFNIFKKQQKEERNNEITYVKPFSSGALFFNYYDNGAAMGLSTVFAAVDMISNSMAELPIVIKTNKDEINNKISSHPIIKLFDTAQINKFLLIKQVYVDMLLYGNGYIYIRRDQALKPIELVYLNCKTISINYTEQTNKLVYLYTGNIKNIPSKIYKEDILHFYKNSYDGIHGLGVLNYASRSIMLSNYTEEAAKDYFGSGCSVKGILKFNEQVLDVNKDEIRQNWAQVHGGSNGSGLAVCDYNVDFIPISQDAAKSQMIESRLYNVTEIARFFGISPVLLQDLSHSSYSTIEAAQLEYVTHTLLPYISLFEAEVNRKLGNNRIWIDLDETYLMTTDKQNLAGYLKTLKDAGIISINEARNKLGLNPVEGGDILMVNYTNIEDNTIAETNKNTDKKE